jgi:hypothetical protein
MAGHSALIIPLYQQFETLNEKLCNPDTATLVSRRRLFPAFRNEGEENNKRVAAEER